MKSSTKSVSNVDGDNNALELGRLVGEDWGRIMACIPSEVDVEMTAKQAKAMRRRREIKSGVDLLRLVMAYTVCDWSLRMVGIWCRMIGIGNLSDVAVMKRLRNCRVWLGRMVFQILEIRRLEVKSRGGVRLRIMDGTWVSKPGSTGTDWRIHLSMDLGHLCVDGLEITDAQSGETFGHCSTQPGDIRMGDRGYAFPESMGTVLAHNGWLVVRINWQSVALKALDGRKIDLMVHSQQMIGAFSDQEVQLNTPHGSFIVRLILGALPQAAADKARHRVRKMFRKKGKTPDERTVWAAGFVMLITNLTASEWPAREVLKLYRLRWQIELLIKRLKSILNLDHLRALEAQLAQVYLLGKLLALLMLDELFHQTQLRCPTWFNQVNRPLNVWRLTGLFFDHLRQIIRGYITLPIILDALPRLKRFLCNGPRKRLDQLSQARALLLQFSD